MDFIPNYIYKSSAGEISNSKSIIERHGDLHFISFEKAINLWNLKTNELIHSFRNKKYIVTYFITSDSYLIVGYSSGLIKIYNSDTFEQYLEYKIHTKRITKLIKENDFVFSSSSDGMLIKFDMIGETYKKIAGLNSIDTFCISKNITGIACTNNTFTYIIDENERTMSISCRVKFLLGVSTNKILFVFSNNEIKILNLIKNEFQNITKFKKIRCVKIIENFLWILTEKKIYKYDIYKSFEPFEINKILKKDIVNFDSNDIFITKNNSFIIKNREFSSHKSEILKIFQDKNSRICTFSSDCFIIWNVENKLIIYNKIDFSNGKCCCEFKNWYVIGTDQSVVFYDIDSLKIYKVIDLKSEENCNIFVDSDIYLGIAINKTLYINNNVLEIIETFTLQDYISCLKITEKNIFVGLINSKVYIYNYEKELLKTLYGHSLPVVNIQVYNNLIYTIGLDKMLKIWGIEFGDCRKSIIVNDAKNIQILDSIFIVPSDSLKYYKGFKLYYEKKYTDCNLIYQTEKNMITAKGVNITIYDIDKYELELIDHEDDVSDIVEQNYENVIHIDKFDNFINCLETNIGNFNTLLYKLDASEINTYINLLNLQQINTFIKKLNQIEYATVKYRIIKSLFSSHQEIVCKNQIFLDERKKLLDSLYNLRNKIGRNIQKLKFKTGFYNFQ